MDRELSPATRKHRKRKRMIIIGSVIILGLVSLFVFNFLISFPLERRELLIGKAIRDTIRATLNASGTIQPEFEEMITSPVSSRILRVLVPTGNPVDSGASILELDLTSIQNQLNQSVDQLNLFKAQFEKSRLALEKSVSDLENQRDIRKLKNHWYLTEKENAEKLFSIGGAMEEEVKKASLDYQIALLELHQLERQIDNQKSAKQAQLQEMELNIRIQDRLVGELQERLSQSHIRSGRKGVVTWVKDQVGSHVEPGEILVKIADLTSFKIGATISDIYADKIFQAQEVLIRLNDTELTGFITTIEPAVINGYISFSVGLNDKSNPVLRPHQKVDVFPVTMSKQDVILLPREAVFNGAKEQWLFVIRDGKAYRTRVVTGLTNFDYTEIEAGIQAGDEVILSDMKKYERRSSIRIND
jgi:HlyD family secretion protein